jgi:predicted homoserine dehydrogenase-like protein
MQPRDQLCAEVTTVAKRDLQSGQVLEGIGGRTHRAGIMIYAEARAQNALPIGLAKGCKVRTPISKDSVIRYDHVDALTDSLVYRLRMEQDRHPSAVAA